MLVTGPRHRLARSRSYRRPFAVIAVASLVAVLTVIVQWAGVADAAGAGTVTLTEDAPASLLYGSAATITLTATNPTSTPEYNVAFTEVLPAGVDYVNGSSPADIGEPTVIADRPNAGQTTLIWNNAGDLQPGATAGLRFRVQPSTSELSTNPYLPGGSYTDSATVYVQTNARTLIKFDATGAASSYTDLATASGTTTISPLQVTKSDDQPESELPRGVHDHKATYTLTVTNSSISPTDAVVVDDYLPAALEFLGCGGADNTTDSPTNRGSNVEYPDADRLTAGTTLAAGVCPAANTVETVTLVSSASTVDSAPAQPITACTLPAPGCGVYTHVVWNAGNLAAGAEATIKYLAAVPLRANTTTWTGGSTPLLTGAQASNLDNNSGTETHDAEAITNLGVASGSYTGPVHGTTGTPTAVSASGKDTIDAIDLAVQKRVDDPGFVVGQPHRWTLSYQTSEYRSASGVVITDNLPAGLCPLSTTANYVDTSIEPTADSRCAARAGVAPTTAFSSVTESADTSFTITWTLGALDANTDGQLAFSSADRGVYPTADPVSSGDSVTNNVGIAGTATAVPGVPGETTPEAPSNQSSASESTSGSTIAKHVADRSSGKTVSPTSPDCDQTYSDGNPVYVKGDIVCFRLDVTFASGAETLDAQVTDILPANVDYVAGSAQPAAGNTAGVSSVATDADGDVVFTLSDGTTHSGRRYLNPGDEFHYYLAVTVNADPAAGSTADITANLLKLTSSDSSGRAISRRSQADYTIGTPQLQLVTGVQNITHDGTSDADRAANVDHVQVQDSDVATIRVDVTNNGAVPAVNASVSATAPTQLTDCTQITNISNGGTCAPVGGKPVITWTNLPTVAAGAALTLNYDLAVPATTVAGADLSTTASVVSYQSATDVVGGANDTYVPGTNGVPTTDTSDPTDVYLAVATATKVAHTSVTETGNTDAQATIGEVITYTVTQTVPKGTTVFNGTITDALGANQVYVPASASATVSGLTSPPTVTTAVVSNTLTATYPAQLTATATADVVVTVTFQATVADVAANKTASTVTNQASFAFNNAAGTAQTLVSTNATSLTIVEPKISVTKTDGQSGHVAAPGTNVAYTVKVTDASTANVSTAHNLVVTDTLPAGMGAPTAISDSGSYSGSGTTADPYVLTWTLATLPANNVAKSLTYSSTVPNPVAGKQQFRNAVGVIATSLDPATWPAARTTYNATTNDTVTATGPSAVKSGSPTAVTVGDDTTYTVTITVPTGMTLPDFTAVDTLPDGMTFDSYVGATCTTPSGSCSGFVGTGLPTPTKAAGGTTKIAWFLGDFADEPSLTRTIELTYTAYPSETNHSGVKPTDQSTLVNSVNEYWNAVNGTDPSTIATLPTFTYSGSAAPSTVTVNLPVVTIAKAATPTSAKVGDDIGYTITLGNTGHAAAYDLTVTDPLPVGLSVPTSISGSGTYEPATRTITWHLDGPLAVNPSPAPTLTFTATLDAPNASTGVGLDNAATVTKYWGDASGSTLDQTRYPVYSSSPAHAVVTPVFPHLVVAKTVSDGSESGTAQVGQPFTWKLSVSNATPAPANTVVVTDTLPTGWSYVDGSTKIGGVTVPDPDITGSVLSFALPGTVTDAAPVVITYAAVPSASATLAPAAGVNTAYASGKDADGNDHNGSGPYRSASDAALAVVASADLTLTKTLNGALVPGRSNSWTLTVHDNGPSAALGPIVVTDVLPTGATAVSAAGAGWSCTPYDAGSNTISCSRAASLANGGTDANLVVTATFAAATTGSVTNTASATSSTYDPDLSNNTGVATDPVTGSADLSITKRHVGSLTAGSTGSYVIDVHNAGPSDSQATVRVTDQLPAGETFLSSSDVGNHWSCSADAGQQVTCTLDAKLAADADTSELTLDVKVASSVTGALTNTASVSGTTEDPVGMNNSATDTTTPSRTDDLAITKTHTGDFTAGANGTYTISVTNNGPSDEPGPVVVTDTLPAGESLVGNNSGWTCTGAGQVQTCTSAAGITAGGAPLTLTLTVAVASSVADGAVLHNAATVKGTLTDIDDGNDSADDATTVQRSADLSLTKAVDGSIVPGAPASWTLTISNEGPSDAAGPLTVVDTLPAGATDPGLTADAQTAGWSCTFDGDRTLTCTRAGGVAADTDDATLDVTATMPAATTGSVTNAGVVSSPTSDPKTSNNSASTTDTVTPSADLKIGKTHTGSFVAGGSGTYTITVANLGSSDAAGPIEVTDVLPTGLTYASGPSTGWDCSADGATVTCTRSAGLAADADPLSFDIAVDIASTVTEGTTLTNSASVTGPTSDPNSSNNTASDEATVSAHDDLAITKTHVGDFTAGEVGTYTLLVTNSGPSAEAGPVVVVDTLPAGETFHSASGTGWAVAHDDTAGTITLTRAAGLGAHQDAPDITVEVDVASAALGTLTNSATVSGTTTDTDPGNNAADDPTDIDTVASLAVTKSHTGNFTAGGSGTYTLEVTNSGPSDEAGPIVVTDTLPAGETYASTSGSGWTCTPNAGATTVVCTHVVGLGADSGPLILTLGVDIDDSVADGSVLTNAATVHGATDTRTHEATDPTTVEAHDDLAITKSHTGDFVAGTNGSYLVDVTNNGPSAEAGPVTVTDTLPAGETFVSATGSGWSCDANDATITCTSGDPIAAYATAPSIHVTVAVDPSATGSLTNRAAVTGSTDDTDSDNNSTSDPTGIETSADLVITKSHTGTFSAGKEGVYTLQVGNRGPSEATNVVVTDALPSDETFVSATGTGWSCDADSGTVTCALDDPLAEIADAAPITLTIRLAANVTPGNAKDNTAKVTSEVPDPDPESNSSTDNPGDVDTEADLSIVKAATDDHFTAGRDGTYTLDVHNGGAADAAGPLVVTDELPAGETFVSASGNGWNCDAASGTVTCEHAAGLAAGADAGRISLTIAIDAAYLGNTVSNTASVVSETHDPDTSNNASTLDEPVRTSAALRIVKHHDTDDDFTPGTHDTYTLHVGNDGPSDAQSVRVADALPAGETLVSAAGGGGAGSAWDCTASTTTTVDCSLDGAFAANAESTITVVVAVDPGLQVHTLTNIATVSTSTGGSDPDDETSTDVVEDIAAEADLAVAKSHTGDAVPGESLEYTLGVSNNGPSDETGAITLTDTLPEGETLVSVSGAGWDCSGTGRTITCVSGDDTVLAPGGAMPDVSVVAAIDASVADGTNLVNRASVAGITADPVGSNDSVDDPATAHASADLSVVKASTGPFVAGRHGTYRLAVSNAGPSDAAGPVTVSDTLPAGETFVSADGTGWECSTEDGTVTCTLSDGLAAGANAEAIDLVVALDGKAYPTVVNTATVGSSTDDPTPANNSGSDTTTVGAASDLAITKTHDAKAYADGTLAYTIDVTNNGITSDPGPITVSDRLPTGEAFVSAIGDGWSCTDAGAEVTCVRSAPLEAKGSARFVLTVRTLPSAVPSVTNTATVGSPSDTTTHTATDPTRVLPVADLSPRKRLVSGKLVIGARATYEIAVTNHGPSATAGRVTVTDALPAALGYVSAGGAGWTCHAVGQTVTCVRKASIANGAVAAVRVVVLVRSGAGTIVNSASVSSATAQTADPSGPSDGHAVDSVSVSNPVSPGSETKSSGQTAGTGEPVEQLTDLALACLIAGFIVLLAARRRRS